LKIQTNVLLTWRSSGLAGTWPGPLFNALAAIRLALR
jgi:hypothetical protein